MSSIKRTNPRHQGDIGVGAAIAWFMADGWRVAVPLGESQPWDLIVEHPDRALPERVQVKTTTSRSPYGYFVVTVATRGGNRSWNGISRTFDPTIVEWLFVLTDDHDRYLIPAGAVRGRHAINLGARYDSFRLDAPEQRRLPL